LSDQTESEQIMKKHSIQRWVMFCLSLAVMFLMTKPMITQAADPAEPTVVLGNAASYAVLAYSAVTNTGTTTIGGTAGGDVGVYPLTSITGKETMTISGTYHEGDAAAGLAQDALTSAITDATGRAPTTIATELGGAILTGGIYTAASGTFGLTGELTLDAENNPNTVFIFQTSSTLITGDASSITLINGASACNVFWQVGSSATLGIGSTFVGHILATVSITANTGASIAGSLLASTGAVTLSGNTITNDVCPAATTASLTIVKTVVNAYTGILTAADFNLHLTLDGIDVTGSPAVGSETGTVYWLEPGTYVVSEDSVIGYTSAFTGDSTDGTITLVAGDTKTITVTNSDINPAVTTATLTIYKQVVNLFDGTLTPADFNLHITLNGVDVIGSPAAGSSTGTVYVLEAGIYVISEDAVTGYTLVFTGDSTDGTITLDPGDNKSVTLTNSDINPTPLPETGPQETALLGGFLLTMSVGAWILGRKRKE
jgi:LPXTG-motif cell wall-anchored protein